MKSKFQKKKDREREVRKKILAKRENKLRQEKENTKFDNEARTVRHKPLPIRSDEFRAAQYAHDLEIRLQLENNMKLLEGLQNEYEEELKNQGEELNKQSLAEKAANRLQQVYENQKK